MGGVQLCCKEKQGFECVVNWGMNITREIKKDSWFVRDVVKRCI